MKKLTFLLTINLFVVSLCYSQFNYDSLSQVGIGEGDYKFKSVKFLKSDELQNVLLPKLYSDKSFKVLVDHLQKSNYLVVKDRSWGYTGSLDVNGKIEEVKLFMFDIVQPKTKQSGTIVWRQIGKQIYKCYLLFDDKSKTWDDMLAKSQEWYVNSTNKIVKAQSWGKCFRKCVKRGETVPGIEVELPNGKSRITLGPSGQTMDVSCSGVCWGFIAVCGFGTGVIYAATVATIFAASSTGVGVAAVPYIAVAGVTGGIGFLGICAGAGCSLCYAVCGVGCIN